VELPYRCPVLNGNYLKPPCEGQVAAAVEFRRKFAHAVMPYGLEQCNKCGGKALETTQVLASKSPVIVPTLPEMMPKYDRKYDKAVDIQKKDEKAGFIQEKGEMTDFVQEAKEDQDMGTAVKFKDQEEAERVLGPRKIPMAVEEVTGELSTSDPAPRCPKHPKEPQVACGPDSKRAGQYLGACKVCMAERKTGRKPKPGKAMMTAAVARDLNKGTVKPPAQSPESVRQIEPVGSEIDVQGQDVMTYPLSAVIDAETVLSPKYPCNNHPDRAAKIDRLGRNMRLCEECLVERGRKSAQANREAGVTGAPFSIPLNAGKWAELKAWLEEQAGEYERTLQQEIMFRLKLAMREANP
jgi:hypothetical protein